MSKFILLIIIFLFIGNYAFGCSLALKRISDFDIEHYIFIGEVVEVIKQNKPKTDENKALPIGLKIKVVENVFSPKQSSFYEVYPLRIQPDCSLTGDIKDLSERFPVGSQVRLIAKEVKEAKILRDQTANSVIQLETSIFNKGSIARNDLSDINRTSAKSFYDYGSFVPMQAKSAAEYLLAESISLLPEFELRKDLLRLKELKSEDERIKILERLIFYPPISWLDLPKMARTYIKNEEKIAALEKQYWQRVEEYKSKQQ